MLHVSNRLGVQRTKVGVAQAKTFGERVRRARLAAAISQEKLGELSGLHRTYIGHVERGEVNPSLYNILRLAAAIGVDPGDLIAGLKP